MTNRDDEPRGEKSSCSSLNEDGTEDPQSGAAPVVPFPYLPLDEDRRKIRWQHSLVFLLFLLNAAVVVHAACHKHLHRLHQLRNDVELAILDDELAASQVEVDIRRERMNAHERARAEGSGSGSGSGAPLTARERGEWLEQFRALEASTRAAMEEFHLKLSEF